MIVFKFIMLLKLNPVTIGRRELKTRSIPCNDNQLRRMHWAERGKWAKAWKEEVGWAVQKYRSKTKEWVFFFHKKLTIQVIFYCIKTMDSDNAMAAIKPLIDGLVDMEVIKDDSDAFVKILPVMQIKVSKREEEHVEIVIK